MKVSIFLGRRLQLRPQDGRGAAPGVFIAVTGIALSLIIMLLSVSVVIGFKKEISQKLEGFNASISLYDVSATTPEKARTDGIKLTDELKEDIKAVIPEGKISLSIHQPAILKTDDAFQGVIIKGYPDSTDVEFMNSVITEGEMPTASDNNDNIVISQHMASALQLRLGDKIFAHFLDNNNIKTRRFVVSGIYDSHFSDFDKMYAFTKIETLQKLVKVDNETGSTIEINGVPIADVDKRCEQLYQRLLNKAIATKNQPVYSIDTITNKCALFFNWLELLNTNVWVILILMSCVSSFTLISSMFILILERVKTIGLLKAIGASNRIISHTFVYMAIRLVIKGMIVGNAVGLSIMFIQRAYHIVPLDANAYYLNYVPISIDWGIIALLNIAVLLVSWLVLILPSQIISRMSPVKALRYE